MNYMMSEAEMERYPIFSQGFEKSRAAALHHSFVWERPALSVFSRQQSAQNTQHRHYTDKTRVLASGVKACWVKDSFRKRRVRLFEKAVFPLLMFRSESLTNQGLVCQTFWLPGPTFHSLILDKPSLIFFLSFQFVHEHENGSPLSQSSSSLSSSINQAQSPTTSSLQRCYASSFFLQGLCNDSDLSYIQML